MAANASPPPPPPPPSPSGPVIASSNRFNDLFPYCCRLWRADPHTWGSILPWHFPQNASRSAEESFLRQYFDDGEIYMQGGATGPGNGFRFLKHVWYCVALDNYERRVPAMAAWWRRRDEANDRILRDEKMQKYIVEHEVLPQAWFSPAEMRTYGHEFLSCVVQYIQADVKRSMAASLPEESGVLKGPSELPIKPTTTEAVPEPRPKTTVSVPANSSPFPALVDPTRTTSSHPHFTPDREIQTRKRGNSTGAGKRHGNLPQGSQRFKPRQQQPVSNERAMSFQNSLAYSLPFSQMGSMPPPPTQDPMRVMSGGPPDYVTLPRQLQALHGSLQSGQFAPQISLQPEASHRFPPPGILPQPSYGRAPLPTNIHWKQNIASDRAFDNRDGNGNHLTDPQFSADKAYSKRGGRRNSQASRGGRTRGSSLNGCGRGKGSRGSNNFYNHFEPDTFGPPVPTGAFPSQPDPGAGRKGHRGSVRGEKNWRSGSDRPQQQDENMQPGRIFSSSDRYPRPKDSAPGMPSANSRAGFQELNSTRLAIAPPSFGLQSQRPDIANLNMMYPEMAVERNHIGAQVHHVLKLMIFGVARETPDHVLQRYLDQIVPGARIRRLAGKHGGQGYSTPFFVDFRDPIAARTVLARNGERLSTDDVLKMEVPREYWDPEHPKYQEQMMNAAQQPRRLPPYEQPEHRPHVGTAPTLAYNIISRPGVAETLQHCRPQKQQLEPRSNESTPTASVIAPDERGAKETKSGDTTPTPTPSGASTPKKWQVGKKNKAKKPTGILEKALCTAQTKQERKSSMDFPSDTPEEGVDGKVEPVAALRALISRTDTVSVDILDPGVTSNLPEPPSAMVQLALSPFSEEAQTNSEPAVSPVPEFTAKIPPITRDDGLTETPQAKSEQEVSISLPTPENDIPEEKSPPKADQAFVPLPESTAKVPPVSEGSTPTHVETPALPRQAEKTEEDSETSRTHAAKQDSENTVSVPKASHVPETSEETLDDSFHTATGSPDIPCKVQSEIDVTDSSSPTQGTRRAAEEVATHVEKTDAKFPSSKPLESQAKKVPIPNISIATSKSKTTTVGFILDTKAAQAPDVAADDGSQPAASDHVEPPTPAFFTAISTPAEPNDDPATANLPEVKFQGKPTTEPGQRVEKQKGPAQTESFSLYGKKKSEPRLKKGKGAKGKSSVKGKEMLDFTFAPETTRDRSLSEVASGRTTPRTEVEDHSVIPADAMMMTTADDEENRTTIIIEDILAAPQLAQTDVDQARESAPASPPTPQRPQSLLSGLLQPFLGGTSQSFPAVPESQVDQAQAQETLTASKASQDHQVEAVETNENLPPASIAAIFEPERSEEPPSQSAGEVKEDSIGSSVDTSMDPLPIDEEGKAKKKTKKKPRRRKKKTTDSEGSQGVLNESQNNTPEPESSVSTSQPQSATSTASLPTMFTFDFPHNQSATTPTSDSSSHTMGRNDTSTSPSEEQSPIAKRIANSIANGPSRLATAPKVPALRRKAHKRVASSKTTPDLATMTSSEGGNGAIEKRKDPSPVRFTNLVAMDGTPPMLYLYVPNAETKEAVQEEALERARGLLGEENAAPQ